MKSVIKRNNNIHFSVLLCCYNDEKYITTSINSILNQEYKYFEIIIIDDGSESKTKKILDKFKKQDERIKIFTNSKNIGLTKSLNKGIKLCKYEWIARIDADDLWERNKLLLQSKFINQNKNLVLICSSWFNINTNGKIINRVISNENKVYYNIRKCIPAVSHSTVIFNKKTALTAGLFRERLYSCQDLDFWKRIIEFGDIKYLSNQLSKIRIHENQITRKNRSNQLLNSLIIKLSMFFKNKFNIDLIDDLNDKVFTNLIKIINHKLIRINYFNLRIKFEENKFNLKKNVFFYFLFILLNINYLVKFKLFKMFFYFQLKRIIFKLLKKNNVL